MFTGTISPKVVAESTIKLLRAFPELGNDFVDLLLEFVMEEGKNDDWLINSIKEVIKTCQYPKPTIAQFMKQDKTIKVYSFTDLDVKINENPRIFESHKAVQLAGSTKPMFVHINDIAKYNLKLWEKKN